MTNEIATELAPHLTHAGILMFEYDPDGFLVSATGSCLGTADPALEVRAGLVSSDVVRRVNTGEFVVSYERVGGRTIRVLHEPVRGTSGRVERILATAVAC